MAFESSIVGDKDDIVRECNKYWRNQLEARCPNASYGTGWVAMELDGFNITYNET